jgi:hypothetical protein
MPQRGVTAKVAPREYEAWLEESEEGGWTTRLDDQVAPRRTPAPSPSHARTLNGADRTARRTVTIRGDGTSGYFVPGASDPPGVPGASGRASIGASARTSAAATPDPGNGHRPAPTGYSTTVPDRRRPRQPRHERAGFRPDRAAFWAVVLCLVLLLVAATSSRGAQRSTGGSARAVGAVIAVPNAPQSGAISYAFRPAP